MKRKTMYASYAALRADGRMQNFKAPAFFDLGEVLRHMPHSLLFAIHIPNSGPHVQMLWAGGRISTSRKSLPKTESEAMEIWRLYNE
jgi:hypothetical protein